MIPSHLIGLYLTIIIVVVFVAIYGYRSLEELIYYIELNIKYFKIRVQLYFMGRRMRRELKQMVKQFDKDRI